MENYFGQDIQPGSYIALGQRAGNGTETRVGRVISISITPQTASTRLNDPVPTPRPKAKALVLWEEELASRAEDGYTYQSMIDFWKLFLIDGDSLSPRIRRHLDNKYNSLVSP